ncbi:RICIN domain-containing protein [Kitasatospora nipponensis]|uniref:RICIN domain-containing protein n=1 Tax=Kitasatospora nipponensis TaxID=258049 RepID=UPI0031E2EF15
MQSTGGCLTARPDGSTVVRLCDGRAEQRWSPVDGALRTLGGAFCLAPLGAPSRPGTPVGVLPCTGSAGQVWHFEADGSLTGVPSGLCLDVLGRAAGSAAPRLWPCERRPGRGPR